MGGTSDAVVAVRDLRKRYGEIRAVDGISFTVQPGEVFGLLGPNGAGKTTTVEILEGLRTPDGGEVSVLGHHPLADGDALRLRIGVTLQTAALFPRLTVTEVIDLFRSFYPRSLPTRRLVDWLQLGEVEKVQTQALSGGQRQRLAVALALVNDPELLFLDEPTTGLDPAARRALWELIVQLRSAGRTILLTTHYMDEAEALCDRVAIIDHGRILEMGTVAEVVGRHFQERTIRFRRSDGLALQTLRSLPGVRELRQEDEMIHLYSADVSATVAALLALAEEAGADLHDLSVRRASLEDVFLALTGTAIRD
jgi:ABC-2 type transport system ATP-binding protein